MSAKAHFKKPLDRYNGVEGFQIVFVEETGQHGVIFDHRKSTFLSDFMASVRNRREGMPDIEMAPAHVVTRDDLEEWCEHPLDSFSVRDQILSFALERVRETDEYYGALPSYTLAIDV